MEINVEVKKFFCKAGVKGIQVSVWGTGEQQHIFFMKESVSERFSLLLQLHGKLRVILEPLIGDVPLVGAITMFFIQRPVNFPKLCFVVKVLGNKNNQNVVLVVM